MTHSIFRWPTQTTILTSSATETSIISQSIAANKLLSTKVARGRLVCILRNSSGADRTYTFRLKFGGSTIIDDAAIAVPTAAGATDLRSVIINFEIAAQDSTTVQAVSMTLEISPIRGLTTGSSGDWGAVGLLPPSTITGTGAATTTNANTLDITVQADAGTATQSFILRYGYMEII